MNSRTFANLLRHSMSVGILAAASTAAWAGPVEQVNLTGSGTGGHTTIQTAVDAVDDGGEVQIIEAGTYSGGGSFGTTSLPGGKTFTIRGTVPGVVLENNATGNVVNVPATGTGFVAGNVNVTIEDLTMRRTDSSGSAFDVDQRASDTITITLNRCTIEHTLVASGGEAIKFDDGDAGAGAMTLNATDCTLTASTTSGSGKSAIRVQSDLANMNNMTVNLTNCTLNAQNEGAIRIDSSSGALTGHSWTLTGCTINSADRGLEVDDPMDNATFTVTGTTITSGLEAVLVNDLGNGNTWTIRRSTFDNSASSNTRCVRLAYTGGTDNAASVYNSVFLTSVTGTNARGIDIDAVGTGTAPVPTFHHNTFAAVGGTGVEGAGRAIAAANSGPLDFSNNIIMNFVDPVGGSTGTKSKNIIVGTTDETSGGADRLYIASTDFATAIAAAGLDAGYVPLTSSVAVAFGDPAIDVGGVDRTNGTRPLPAATNPDAGAYEVNQGSAVQGWSEY